MSDPDNLDYSFTTGEMRANWIKGGHWPDYGDENSTRTCNDFYYTDSLITLTFTADNGTQYKFVDQITRGAINYFNDTHDPVSRGRVWITTDNGTSATFVIDQEVPQESYLQTCESSPQYFYVSGYLYFKNGVVYRIDNGQVSWMRDTNGNSIKFEYGAPGSSLYVKATDSLNRQITITTSDEGAPYGFCSVVTYKGIEGQTRKIRIGGWTATGGTTRIFPELYYPQYAEATYGTPYSWDLWLPDNRKYQFQQNGYGELTQVTLPTGGGYQYDYGPGTGLAPYFYISPNGIIGDYGPNDTTSLPENGPGLTIYRRVKERRVYKDMANGQLESKTAYEPVVTYNSQTGNNIESVAAKSYDSNGHALGGSRHEFYWDPYMLSGMGQLDQATYIAPYSYLNIPWDGGREYKTETLDQNWNAIRRVEHTWNQGVLPGGPRITDSITTLLDTNQVSKKHFEYDAYSNVTQRDEYDFGNGAPGPLLRMTTTDYLATNPINGKVYNNPYPVDLNIPMVHMRNLPVSVQVFDAANNKREQTSFEYDNYTADSNHAALVNYPDISGLCTYTTVQNQCTNTNGGYDSTGYLTRGNITAATKYLLNGSGGVDGSISAYIQYDIAGNTIKSIDPNGNVSTINYSDNFGVPDGEARSNTPPVELSSVSQHSYAFPTSFTNPLGWTAYTQFDFFTGKPVNSEDFNGLISETIYNDVLDRPTQVISAVGTTSEAQSSIVYDDVNHRIQGTSDLNALNDNLLKSESYYDGLSRTVETRKYEAGGGYVAVQIVPFLTVQDPLTLQWSSAIKTSNPFRPNSGETAVWTTFLSDELGRRTKAITPDGAIAKTDYSGNATTITDQAGKQRRSINNALGLLTRVDEPTDAGGLGTVANPNQWTSYTYDILGNLTTSNQGGQTRSFAYNSLSRLLSATNPESGTVSYTYDANGNLTAKTDARNISTTYTYDALNRLTAKTFSDATPAITYFYDNLPNAKGRLTKVSSAVSTTENTGFDIKGGILTHQQTTDGAVYTSAYVYNLSGALLEETYPSGRKVRNTLNTDGNLSLVETQANGGTYQTRANNLTFTAAGAVSSVQLGNGLWESTQFNSRLEPTQIELGTTQNGADQLKLNYDYGTTANNGNVLSQTITVPTVGANQGFTAVQNYEYDSLNRLKSATETLSASQTWKQAFLYDRYGNRNFDTANTTTLGSCSQAQCNPSIDANSNRFSTGQGYVYDSVGNIVTDTEGRQFTYDAVNKQTIVKDANNAAIGEYVYDGSGRRVKKISPNETTTFVYDALGRLIEEYSNQTATAGYVYAGSRLLSVENPTGTNYLTTDNLGTPRIDTDPSGSVIARHDYHPFGEEILGLGGRTAGLGYNSDPVRKTFTGYESDTETDLDFAQARYYSKTLGRFYSTDPSGASAKKWNPQTINRYSYVTNNPLNFIDPTGLNKQGGTCVTSKVQDEGSGDGGTVVSAKEEAPCINDDGTIRRTAHKILKALRWIGGQIQPAVSANDDTEPGGGGGDEGSAGGGGGAGGGPPMGYPEQPLPPNGDTELFRGMNGAEEPAIVDPTTANSLGARPLINGRGDIPVDPEGMVNPGTGGMSVNQDNPLTMQLYRLPNGFGDGTAKTNLYCILCSEVEANPGLVYKWAPADGNQFHGVIEPAYRMSFEQYQMYLRQTQPLWMRQFPPR